MNYIEEKAQKLGVSTEVYVFLRQSGRKIRYFTHDLKADTIIIDGDKVIFIPGREDSLDRLADEGILFSAKESVEDTAIDNLLQEQLRDALKHLSDEERWLIENIWRNPRLKLFKALQSLGIRSDIKRKFCWRN